MRRAIISPAVARRRSIVVLLVLVATFGRVSVVDSSIPRSSSGSIVASSSSSSSSQSSPPSSAGGCDDDGRRHLRGRPWNASPKINGQGYLCELYRRIPGEWEEESSSSSSSAEEEEGGGGCPPHPHPPNPRRRRPPRGEVVDLDEPVIVRQVPGDGCCLFHAVAVSLNLIHGRHLRMDDANSLGELKVMSRSLRRTAVGCLRSCGDRRHHRRKNGILPTRKRKYSRLFIQGDESMSTSHLLSTAAAQYGISPEEYCDLMEQDSYWGGGPEIVALCNVLERPIHVYELVGSSGGGGGGGGGGGDTTAGYDDDDECAGGGGATTTSSSRRGGERGDGNSRVVPDRLINKQFRLRRMATFGSPKYDTKVPLHILSADSRFPDVSPEIARENGNHFMAIFPVSAMREYVNDETATSRGKEGGGGSVDSAGERKRRVRGGAAPSTGGGGNVDGRPRGARSVVASPPSEESDDGGWPSRGGWSDDFKYGCAPPLLDGDGMGGCDWILRDRITSSSPPGASSRCWWYPTKLLRQQHDGGYHQPDNKREEWEGGDQ